MGVRRRLPMSRSYTVLWRACSNRFSAFHHPMIKKIAEVFELFYLHFAVRGYEWLEQRRVRKQFYQDPHYKALDQALLKGPNPYRVKEAFPYGETPLCSLKKIADRFGLKASDKVV